MITRELVGTITDALVSYAQTTGLFETVNKHEFKNAPPEGGVHGNVWVAALAPYVRGSGLDATSVRMEFTFRLYGSMLEEPQDDIDANLITALDHLMDDITGDFTLDGLVRNVDLLGQAGAPLSARTGYLSVSGKMMRVIDLTIPLIINDAWGQQP